MSSIEEADQPFNQILTHLEGFKCYIFVKDEDDLNLLVAHSADRLEFHPKIEIFKGFCKRKVQYAVC